MTKPLKVMYHNPVGTSGYDQVFADMVAAHKLPIQTTFVRKDIL